MTFGWYDGRPWRSTCPTRRMFFCSPLWLMPFASAPLAPSTKLAATVADKTDSDLRLRMLDEMRITLSFGMLRLLARANSTCIQAGLRPRRGVYRRLARLGPLSGEG